MIDVIIGAAIANAEPHDFQLKGARQLYNQFRESREDYRSLDLALVSLLLELIKSPDKLPDGLPPIAVHTLCVRNPMLASADMATTGTRANIYRKQSLSPVVNRSLIFEAASQVAWFAGPQCRRLHVLYDIMNLLKLPWDRLLEMQRQPSSVLKLLDGVLSAARADFDDYVAVRRAEAILLREADLNLKAHSRKPAATLDLEIDLIAADDLDLDDADDGFKQAWRELLESIEDAEEEVTRMVQMIDTERAQNSFLHGFSSGTSPASASSSSASSSALSTLTSSFSAGANAELARDSAGGSSSSSNSNSSISTRRRGGGLWDVQAAHFRFLPYFELFRRLVDTLIMPPAPPPALFKHLVDVDDASGADEFGGPDGAGLDTDYASATSSSSSSSATLPSIFRYSRFNAQTGPRDSSLHAMLDKVNHDQGLLAATHMSSLSTFSSSSSFSSTIDAKKSFDIAESAWSRRKVHDVDVCDRLAKFSLKHFCTYTVHSPASLPMFFMY